MSQLPTPIEKAGAFRVRPKVRPHAGLQARPKRQPPYAVILHNDPINEMDFVVRVLKKVFHYGTWKAFKLMIRAHVTGQSLVWSGSLEVAELKAEQIRDCGPDPRKVYKGARPLTVTTEPLPE